MTSKTDSELVALYAGGGAGAEAAFAEIVRRHGALVYAACRRLLGNAAAEDAVQAVFMLLARKARTLSKGEALAGWLYGAASLVAREHLRSARRRAGAEKEAAAMREAEKGSPAGIPWSELRPEIDAALGALPRPYRDAVVLSCLEGKPEAEVARELGVPAGTVKSRVSRGLERLRERLGQRGTVTSAAALAGLLGAHGAEAMPAALAAKVVVLGQAGAAVAGAGSAGFAMMEGAMKAMFWVKVKLAAAVLAGAAVVGGGGAAVIIGAAEPAVPKVYPPGRAENPKPEAEPAKPAVPAEAGKVAWGEAADGLQAGLVPLGGVAAKDWPEPFLCVKCREFNRMYVVSKCEDCGGECNSNRKLRLCTSCAAKKRVCQACGAAKPSGAAFAEGNPLVFEVHLRNTGEAPKEITGAWRVFEQNFVFAPKGGGTPRRAKSTVVPPMGGGGMAPQHLDKGRQIAWVVSFGGGDWQFEDATQAPRDAALAAPTKSLPDGKYTVTAAYPAGKVTTGAVEIESKPKAAAGSSVPASGAEPRDPGSRPDRPAPAEWQKLFADEGWYKNQAGEEQVFTGKLGGVPAGGPSTFQRNSYYKLGERTLYTGAAKVPALDALVGKQVEVRGKPVDMNGLEGRNVREIWPAAVRAAQ